MKSRPVVLLRWPALLCLAVAIAPAMANDFPTAERVIYVEECISGHPGAPRFELISKCSCALDAIAQELSYVDYVQISTSAKAVSIGGERGSYIRDAQSLQDQVKRYRALQAKAGKSCLLAPAVP